jgi:hypothetical protein
VGNRVAQTTNHQAGDEPPPRARERRDGEQRDGAHRGSEAHPQERPHALNQTPRGHRGERGHGEEHSNREPQSALAKAELGPDLDRQPTSKKGRYHTCSRDRDGEEHGPRARVFARHRVIRSEKRGIAKIIARHKQRSSVGFRLSAERANAYAPYVLYAFMPAD